MEIIGNEGSVLTWLHLIGPRTPLTHTTIDAVPQPGDFRPIVGRVYDQAFRRRLPCAGVRFAPAAGGCRVRASAPLHGFAQGNPRGGLSARSPGAIAIRPCPVRSARDDEASMWTDTRPRLNRSRCSGTSLRRLPARCPSRTSRGAAHDLGVEPKRDLADFNPMYVQGERRLAPYITRLVEFDPAYPQVLLIDNSRLPFREDRSNTRASCTGHRAKPEASRSRVVNSTMIVKAAVAEEVAHSGVAQQVFLETTAVAGIFALFHALPSRPVRAAAGRRRTPAAAAPPPGAARRPCSGRAAPSPTRGRPADRAAGR